MNRLQIITAFSAILILPAHPAWSAGLYLAELGTPVSIGTAGVGNVTNTTGPDSAFTNPAGMTGLQGDQFTYGVQAVYPTIRFDSDSKSTAGGADGGNAGFASAIPSTFYVAESNNNWRFGIALTAQLGGGVDYGKDFVGRYSAQKSTLSGYGLSPAVAYKINDKLSVGAGVSCVYNDLDLDLAINRLGSTPDGQAVFDELTDWSYQGYMGLTYAVNQQLTIGVVYRSEADAKMEGDLHLKNIPAGTISGDGKITYTYPQLLQIGMKYKLNDKTMILADLDWEEWSAFGETGITMNLANDRLIAFDRNWDDTWHAGIALVRRLTPTQLISCGFSYDSSPVKDKYRTADLPADEQMRISASYHNEYSEQLSYGFGTTYLWLGEGKMDQIVQGERYSGEFSTNNTIFVSATLKYIF